MGDTVGSTSDSSMGDPTVQTVQDTGTLERQAQGEGTGRGATGSDVVDLTPKEAPAVRTILPAPVYRTNGDEFLVPEDIIEAIDNFQIPEGFQKVGSRESSYMYSVGVFVKPLNPSDTTGHFHCRANKRCRTTKKSIPCKNMSRSNVNKHMKDVHNLVGQRYVTRDVAVKKRTGAIEASLQASKTFGAGSQRVQEILGAKSVVEQLLPFNHFTKGESLKLLFAVVTARETPFPSLPPRRIQHLIVELYVATKKAVVGNMVEEVERAQLPILHYLVDLWTCKSSGHKFLGVHVSYINSAFEKKDALLSVKPYAPAQDLEEITASKVLLKIFTATLQEYGVRVQDLASGTTDSGSDVKAMCVRGLHPRGIAWDWCVCHLACKAAENAFGTSADASKSKNPQARELLKLVIKVIERLNKSPNFKLKFEDIQTEVLGEIFKIIKHAPQRWLSMKKALERVIRLWHLLRKLYSDEGLTFPLDEDRNRGSILQLYSLMQPLSAITRDGQYGKVPMTAEMHLAFGKFKTEVLDLDKPLRVFDIPALADVDSPREGGKLKPLPSREMAPEELEEVTRITRQELAKALTKRLYMRVWDEDTPDPSPFRDAAVLLTPPFNTGSYLRALRLTQADEDAIPTTSTVDVPTKEETVKEKLDGAWADIKRRAIAAVKTRSDREEGAGRLLKRPRLSSRGGASQPRTPSRWAAFGRRGNLGGAEERKDAGEEDDAERRVSEDIMRYQSVFVDPDDMEPCDVLQYWAQSGKHAFPTLAPVAQQVFGNQASAAQIEREFSGAGALLTPNRSRIDTYWVEMILFLKANFEHIPEYSAIPKIVAADIPKCFPQRFSAKDNELLKAEAAIDPLKNTAIPPEGMTID